ncbi:phosphotransferase family protein [Bradyrhizobium quebecense]|uniref:Phosphotransferase n=1 Tax=Bradyrhizobium quebecense TaxID=2748629 RepID=A0ACD3V9W1_9BRAD|nr:phosphotransferase [Bradyrhizobium quebecense]UGY02972.1 phosphotransferase [Bradyrhizobium quebecense]
MRDVIALRSGEISMILEIALTDGPSCILKVYPVELHWKMAKEVYVHELLRDVDIPVPRILLADDTRAVIGLSFVLMSKLNGIEPSRRDPALSDEEQFAIFAEMGAALRRINDITLDSFGYIGPNGVWTPHHPCRQRAGDAAWHAATLRHRRFRERDRRRSLYRYRQGAVLFYPEGCVAA